MKHISQNKLKTLEKRYASQINLSMEEFNKRFILFKDEELQLTLIEDPFSVNPEKFQLSCSWSFSDVKKLILYLLKLLFTY